MIGVTLIILGLLLRILSMRKLGKRFSLRLLPQNDIETGGIYSHLRHPSYTGSLLVICGASLLHPSLGIMCLSWAVFMERSINEEFVLSIHPDYMKYMKRTGRFLPKLRR